MVNYLDFNGTQTPIKFGFGALYHYEKITGRTALRDFSESIQGGEAEIKISFIADLAFSGFLNGGKATKKPFAGSVEDVADWLSGDTFGKILELFEDSMPKAKGDESQSGEPQPTA
jgi:hypothetical protein